MTKIKLGCIADDFTGATDLANNLVRSGMRVVQTIGVPTEAIDDDIDAVVVALKTRTCAPADAIAQSLAALAWLQSQAQNDETLQIYFKYCSTFDSTASGNIGPVTDALMEALGTDFTIACPAFPDNGRTVFKGYLFVGDELLHESGMRNHPLTPMLDSNLVRVLQAQTRRTVGLIDYKTVAAGSAAITARIAQLKANGVAMAIVDATSNAELIEAGKAWRDMPLVTAGSGIAIGLPQNFGIQTSQTGIAKASPNASQLPTPCGLQAIVSGSCSVATNGQVTQFIALGGVAFQVDPMQLMAGASASVDVTAQALAWARAQFTAQATAGKTAPILVYATSTPEQVEAVQAKLGVAKSGELIERTLAAIAKGLVQMGVQQLVVAGGETSGACVQALGVTQLRIGSQIAPGVPWCYAHSGVIPNTLRASSASGQWQGLHIALKSGNFGSENFFCEAFAQLLTPL
jgi:3-dehydrotetronate 4-kinase